MSQGNVERLRQALDAFNRRDLDAILALVDDDVEYLPRAAAMEGSHHGHDGIRRWWEDVFDVWPDVTSQLVEERDLGDLTVAAVHFRGHGAGTR
jgi:ketosteroid isomerase-like protein